VSKEDRDNLISELGRTIVELQTATHEVDDAAGERLGVNRTDMRCISYLFTSGAMTAGELAEASGLTPGALTTALDRLEHAGYAQRVRDRSDRRRVLVELTPRAHHMIGEIWGPIADAGRAEVANYTSEQLMLILDFLRRYVELQLRHADRIRGQLGPEATQGVDSRAPEAVLRIARPRLDRDSSLQPET